MSNIEQNLKDILEARYGIDVRQAIHDGIESCYEDGKVGSIDLVARQQIANLVANSGIDEKDSELVDVRSGANGIIYPSAGDSVRDQIESVEDRVESIEEILDTVYNVFDVNDITVGTVRSCRIGYSTTEMTEPREGWFMMNSLIRIKKGDVIYSSIGWLTRNIYDANGVLVEHYNTEPAQITVQSDNARWLGIQTKNQPIYTTYLVISINKPIPDKYIPHKKKSLRIEDVENRVEDVENRVEDVEEKIEINSELPHIFLNFDHSAASENDARIKIVLDEFGFPFSICGHSDSVEKYLLERGCEITSYSLTPPSVGWDKINDESEESLLSWDEYVEDEKSRQENVGVFMPTAWVARQNKTGKALEYAVKKNGYKVLRAYRPDPYFGKLDRDFNVIGFVSFYFGDTEKAKSAVDKCISENKNVMIFTHDLLDSEEESNTGGYDTLKSEYREFLEYLKEKVDAGKCEVSTLRDYYLKCNPEEGNRRSRMEMIKMIKYNSGN